MNDERFKRLFIEQITEEINQLDELEKNSPVHEFSDDFKKQMQKLIEKEKKPYSIFINTAFKKVLCSAAVIALVVGAYFPVKAACSTIYSYVVEKVNSPENNTKKETPTEATSATVEATEFTVSTQPVTQEPTEYISTETVCTTTFIQQIQVQQTYTTILEDRYVGQAQPVVTTVIDIQPEPPAYEEMINNILINENENRYYKTEYGTFSYRIADGGAVITGYSQKVTAAVIPASIEGYPVTEISSMAFNMCSSLEKISFPDTLIDAGYNSLNDTAWYKNQPDGPVYVGNILYGYKGAVPENTTLEIREGTRIISREALYGASGLVKVVIPDSIEYIGMSAFENCENLSEIVFPSGKCVRIDYSVFSNTAWYNSQPDGEVYIGKVFYHYKGFVPENTNVVIREDTKAIAAYAFDTSGFYYHTYAENGMLLSWTDDAVNLESVILNDGLEYIGDWAFMDCTSISEMIIPDSVKEIGKSAFYNCEALADVVLPQKLEVISENMFVGCSSLEYITIPETVTSIENGAFDFTSLVSIVLPKNVAYIGNRAFGNNPALVDVTINNPDCVIYDGKGVIFGSSVMDGNRYVDFIYGGRITGYKGSLAEAYAKKYGISFINLTT